MANRAQRRKMRSMNRRGRGPQVQVREDGEVQLGPKASWKGKALQSRSLTIAAGAKLDGAELFAGKLVFIGTTDTSYQHGSETWPRITREDVEYLLEPIPVISQALKSLLPSQGSFECVLGDLLRQHLLLTGIADIFLVIIGLDTHVPEYADHGAQ